MICIIVPLYFYLKTNCIYKSFGKVYLTVLLQEMEKGVDFHMKSKIIIYNV